MRQSADTSCNTNASGPHFYLSSYIFRQLDSTRPEPSSPGSLRFAKSRRTSVVHQDPRISSTRRRTSSSTWPTLLADYRGREFQGESFKFGAVDDNTTADLRAYAAFWTMMTCSCMQALQTLAGLLSSNCPIHATNDMQFPDMQANSSICITQSSIIGMYFCALFNRIVQYKQ
jgi:hypothetical protein